MGAAFEETACAKVNLSLRVLGRRPEGYHLLESLVVFAAFGDRLVVHQGQPPSLKVIGPFADAIDGANIVAKAATLAQQQFPDLSLGSILLEKMIPVGAGLGGGSADAAALLRAIRSVDPRHAAAADWPALAAKLGADVPVCLIGRPAQMWGFGERIRPVDGVPRLPLVLVKPSQSLATAAVFAELRSGPATQSPDDPALLPSFATPENLARHLHALCNDLEAPAMRLCPEIPRVLAALESAPGLLIARMSGSGPACFGMFSSPATAEAAAASIMRSEPAWWVIVTTTL